MSLPVAFLGLLILAGHAFAHGDAAHAPPAPGAAAPAKAEQHAFGIAGDPAQVSRTIEFEMTDAMRFDPSHVEVRLGETVRFVARNHGSVMHEMVLGTMRDLRRHSALMKKFPGMEHDEPHMAHVAPGMSAEIVWRFNRLGRINFACLIAGHFEAGMVGTVAVLPAAKITEK